MTNAEKFQHISEATKLISEIKNLLSKPHLTFGEFVLGGGYNTYRLKIGKDGNVFTYTINWVNPEGGLEFITKLEVVE